MSSLETLSKLPLVTTWTEKDFEEKGSWIIWSRKPLGYPMAYCRMGVDGSCVYAYADINGGYRGWCEGEHFKVNTLQELKEFLLTARKRGNKVPDYALEEIQKELDDGQTQSPG